MKPINCLQSKFRSQRSLQSGLMGLCGCNLKEKLECSNGIHNGKSWHQIRISRSGKRQTICRIIAMKIRGNILCSGELGSLCCRWNVYHQNLDMVDEMKHLPGVWIWKKHFTVVLFAAHRRPEVCCLCLVTAVENMSVQFVFWGLGPLSKTCLLQKWLPLSAVKVMVIFHVHCDRWCLSRRG